SVEPGPNRFRIVDIPIAPGGVIDGRVLRADSSGAAGITLILTHLESGATRSITSFSDGAFYAMGIRPGRYRLTLDPRVATRLGRSAEPIEFVMAAVLDGATVGDLRLVLK
ncbi:MAG: carboxypeptidase regulatory-like domain-containing protein, partial [Gemmatimonadetes bacterium]|nr:carboxypeptidase regulatory-like domain-containing protein [Gemmatimonadota bacterium]